MTDLPVAALRAAYRTWDESKGADPSEFLALMDEDLTMHSILMGPTDHDDPARGLAAADHFFGAIAADWIMLAFDTEQMVAQDDTIVWIGRCRWQHRRNDNIVDTPKVDVWHFREGRAVRYAEMFDTLAFARAVGME
ncbi:nuclear transport factor 2 family protein [Sphingomonas bacterium]|uniref:nuclear transport factor 2 family protein n=1 Tax=Sphingomonas bacterium TaxID=1895847 RepID=UPI002602623A|nr:nuclear transport factor 2 family protein [Sphingomonas bacterium]MDB5678407.1 nuclear transport factor 2 family protein [Sphingomonas bacterium]